MNDRALAVVAQTQELARETGGGLQFTEQQEEMIRANFSTGATKSEFEVLMAIAKARKLNPLLKQVYFVKRKDKKLNKDVWSVQVSIDGLRAIAERTGAYDGQDEPEFEYNAEKEVILARVKVYKKGVSRPFVGVARWDEYVQKSYEGNPTKFWADMPYTMLGKCAEALAIRKAFPEDSGGLYVAEEMMQAEQPKQLNDPRRGAISPHSASDNADGDPELAAHLLDRLERAMLSDGERFELQDANGNLVDRIKTPLRPCPDYDAALAMRAFLGTRQEMSDWTKGLQAARENLNGLQNKLLNKVWAHCDRQVAKLEKDLAPSAEQVAHDDAGDFDRGA